ncbi:dimethylsulfoniopropionate demethylase [Jannaschia seohaensis]|uniref:Dimethylsulfoniopropionate demethylase n=1 Tax=Jannaschia seohaensis TaxID=475081 RepID=A0A2Y9C775_9RHOB|nr:dimethylsulfoniopropionate demethylase [Jannaschia seohaensis]PWJ20517.1 dimethylsulfoniopropionate demethylase [Jannaschia seohaensis]SSA44613.1 dimethylsulfoniopropionate demethylase [Jannaschia seohaensis]
MTELARSNRVRRTWWTDATDAAGCKAYTVYNRMMLPASFGGPAIDCAHLKRAVQVWDVACERQVEIGGPHADQVMQRLTPRDLDGLAADRCAYVPICNRNGGMLNDPVALRPRPGVWWVSLADGELRLWIEGMVEAGGYDAYVREVDCQPLAVQGPKSDDLAARVFGEEVRSIRFFRFKRLPFQDTELIVSRTGYSKQGGFEIYVEEQRHAMPLWEALFEAGRDLDVRAGCPNLIERIEGGMLSYGNDITDADTPFEVGLEKYVQRFDCIGGAALKRHVSTRRLMALEMEKPVPACERLWPVKVGDRQIGVVSSAAESIEFGCGVAIGMIGRKWTAGQEVVIETQDGPKRGRLREKFWR